MKTTSHHQVLINKATTARKNAYAPYSRFQVGAALCLQDGRIFTGVNVENCSYGLTICAERNAIAAAVGDGAKPDELDTIVIVTHGQTSAPPCGACRQVLAEFGHVKTVVIMHNLKNQQTTRALLKNLLPHAFSSQALALGSQK